MADPVFDPAVFDAALFSGEGVLFDDAVFDAAMFDVGSTALPISVLMAANVQLGAGYASA
jgi:hypothetical protein